MKLIKKELEVLKKLNSFSEIQDFVNKLQVNFEEDGKDSCMSPISVLRTGKAHCIEAAFLAAATIWINNLGNGKPLVVDMRGTKDDWDHVIAVFQDKQTKKWGAISKSNHGVLRYREPVYRDVRELIMSYFHEYTDDKGLGIKTLREFSNPIDLSIFGEDWLYSEEHLWHIHDYLDSVKHFKILNDEQKLRKADDIEIKIGEITEYKRPDRKNK